MQTRSPGTTPRATSPAAISRAIAVRLAERHALPGVAGRNNGTRRPPGWPPAAASTGPTAVRGSSLRRSAATGRLAAGAGATGVWEGAVMGGLQHTAGRPSRAHRTASGMRCKIGAMSAKSLPRWRLVARAIVIGLLFAKHGTRFWVGWLGLWLRRSGQAAAAGLAGPGRRRSVPPAGRHLHQGRPDHEHAPRSDPRIRLVGAGGAPGSRRPVPVRGCGAHHRRPTSAAP